MLVWGNNCPPPSNEPHLLWLHAIPPPPPMACIASLCTQTFTENMFLLVTSAAKGTDGFLRCSLSVIHLNWSRVIRVPFDGRDNRLFLHWHSEAALSEGRVGTLFENLWLTFLTWPEWGNGLNQHLNVLWRHTFDSHPSVKATVLSELTDVQSSSSCDTYG